MIKFTVGNLLDSDAEALVNTVNTVGVMGKGVALMFKEAFPENFKQYELACKAKELRVGEVYVTHRQSLIGPKWIINFPTKAHWRYPSKIEWIDRGLDNLREVIRSNDIKSIALPPLGAGNGGLAWNEVRDLIVEKLACLEGVEVIIYEPTKKYQNISKRSGVQALTVARAAMVELVKKYSMLGIQCSILEVQKLGYFIERFNKKLEVEVFGFDFSANKFGPYSVKLNHMLNSLDGSYLHCEKRVSDASPFEAIRFDQGREDAVSLYMRTEGRNYLASVEATAALIDGFESPLSMELLATVDWAVSEMGIRPDVASIRSGLDCWPGGADAAERKLRLFDDRTIEIAIHALKESDLIQ